jgi:hypothetical protein
MVCGAPSSSTMSRYSSPRRVDERLAFGLHQDLDARLPLVVAPAVAVVDAHDGFDVVEQLAQGRNSRTTGR